LQGAGSVAPGCTVLVTVLECICHIWIPFLLKNCSGGWGLSGKGAWFQGL
jgi:hypothetical protein